ncbi:hypothetical protein X975_00512, partial [Stegodyphus mimosarum]
MNCFCILIIATLLSAVCARECSCGPNGFCLIGSDGQPICYCEDGYQEHEGKCIECSYGPNTFCRIGADGHPNFYCEKGYKEHRGKCIACQCGAGEKTCKPTENSKQICTCDTGYAVKEDDKKGQICAACDCGTGQKACTPKENDKQICTCDTGYAVKTDQTKGQICAG